MMAMNYTAMIVGCGRFIQCENACSLLGGELKQLHVQKAYLLGGKAALEATLSKLEASLKSEQIAYTVQAYSGYCTNANAQSHADRAHASGCDFIVGIGGGKSMDTAKAVSQYTRLPLATVPTQAATCVACTNMAVMYEDDGAYIGPLFPALPIAFTLVDLNVLAQAPIRYIASGIADSMAKYPELHFSQRSTPDCSQIDDATLQAAYGLSVSTWNTLMANGYQAYQDNQEQRITPSLNAIAHTNLLTTGAISGLAKGSKQLAIAHAAYNHSTTAFPDTWRTYTHGEIVSVGIMLQAYYNRMDQKEIHAYRSLAAQMDVPVTLEQIGIAKTAESMDKLHRVLLTQFTGLDASERKWLRSCIEEVAQ